MCYGLICRVIAGFFIMHLCLSPASADEETDQEMETWTYHKEWDKLNNLDFSLVRSPMPKRGLYDDIRLEIICQDKKLQLVAKTSNLITSQGREFDFEYQLDKKPSVAIKMRTFKDSKRRAYTDEQIDRIVGEFLSGQSLFIRINTIISTVLSADIPLKDASGPIQQVLADCGIVQGKTPTQQAYSLADFERDFAKLSQEQQGQILDKIEKIMLDIH
ncbi:hypothetical protein MGMO_36c00030 [Methyloglobulus morosus KoM1]|uniref:Secreted protein n=2 Tax=Methyloglobulus TaxID=1410680 RepID=V5BZ52_9GAMM|nr:hypothetical protein MGMO_36c00030 [Methyloglobulus morosus KoM1]